MYLKVESVWLVLNSQKFHYLLSRKVDGYPVQQTENFIYKWFLLARLLHHKVTATFLSNLNECITSHILHTYNVD